MRRSARQQNRRERAAAQDGAGVNAAAKVTGTSKMGGNKRNERTVVEVDAGKEAGASTECGTGKLKQKVEPVANDPQENPVTSFTGPIGQPSTRLISKSKAMKIYEVDVCQCGLEPNMWGDYAEAEVMEVSFEQIQASETKILIDPRFSAFVYGVEDGVLEPGFKERAALVHRLQSYYSPTFWKSSLLRSLSQMSSVSVDRLEGNPKAVVRHAFHLLEKSRLFKLVFDTGQIGECVATHLLLNDIVSLSQSYPSLPISAGCKSRLKQLKIALDKFQVRLEEEPDGVPSNSTVREYVFQVASQQKPQTSIEKAVAAARFGAKLSIYRPSIRSLNQAAWEVELNALVSEKGLSWEVATGQILANSSVKFPPVQPKPKWRFAGFWPSGAKKWNYY